MALYTIKELYNYYLTLPTTEPLTSFLGGGYWNAPNDPAQPDDRPTYLQFVKDTEDTTRASLIRRWGDWVYTSDCDTVAAAWLAFVNDNVVYELTHRTSLIMVEKALNSDFNPIENYDRYETGKHHTRNKAHAENQTTVNVNSQTTNTLTSNASTKVSPDNLTDDYVNSGASDSASTATSGTIDNNSTGIINDSRNCGTNTDEVHVHGNIGVMRADQMTAAIVNQYSDKDFAMYDVFIQRLLDNSCMLIL